jgi:hypothetical protein
VTEWIQDFMVSHYEMKEIWLGDDYPEGEESDDEDSNASDDEGKVSEVVVKKKVEVKDPLMWAKPSRSGVFVINEEDVGRVTGKEMKRHAKVNIFISPDFYTANKLLVIVQGSGAVRPGQWARALCINHSLKSGTIFDYLDIARECGMATIVLNPNQERLKLRVKSEAQPLGVFDAKHNYPILGHENHVKHILHVYDHFVTKSPAENIWMVAHSRGGDSALQLLNHRLPAPMVEPNENGNANKRSSVGPESKIEPKIQTIPHEDAHNNLPTSDLQTRLRALAFTDSVHWIGSATSTEVVEWVEENAKDWVASKNPLDTHEASHKQSAGCDCYSSGHSKHEWTSPCAVNSVFKFFFENNEFSSIQWTQRRIPFSTPPQNMPSEEATTSVDHVLERGASYADVASGRKSIKMKNAPINETVVVPKMEEKKGTSTSSSVDSKDTPTSTDTSTDSTDSSTESSPIQSNGTTSTTVAKKPTPTPTPTSTTSETSTPKQSIHNEATPSSTSSTSNNSNTSTTVAKKPTPTSTLTPTTSETSTPKQSIHNEATPSSSSSSTPSTTSITSTTVAKKPTPTPTTTPTTSETSTPKQSHNEATPIPSSHTSSLPNETTIIIGAVAAAGIALLVGVTLLLRRSKRR